MNRDIGLGKRFGKAFDSVLKTLGILSFICIIITMLIMSTEVVMRYFLNRPLGWSVEISTYLLVYICYMAAPYVLKNERHVTMDIVYSVLPVHLKAWLDVITSFLIIVISLTITWYSWKVTMDLYQTGLLVHGTVEIPKYMIVLIILVSGLLLVIESTRRTIRHLLTLQEIKQAR